MCQRIIESSLQIVYKIFKRFNFYSRVKILLRKFQLNCKKCPLLPNYIIILSEKSQILQNYTGRPARTIFPSRN